VRYWDPSHDELRGREAVAAVLTGRVELESIAAAESDAVVDLQVGEGGARYRSTEAYRLEHGAITSTGPTSTPWRAHPVTDRSLTVAVAFAAARRLGMA
jgi:hypothetical protein